MDETWIDDRYRAVDKRDEVSRVIAWIRGETDVPPVVFDGKTPFGIINRHAVPGHRIRHDTRVDDVTLPVPCLEPGDDLDAALRKFVDAGTDYLPVRRSDRPDAVGVVRAIDVLAAFDDGPPARASSLLIEPLRPDDSIDHAASRFAGVRATRLPVVADGAIVGALDRTQVHTVQESFMESIGRRDKVGERIDTGDEAVGGYMEDRWCELPSQANYRECVESVRTYGTCFVIDHGRYHGILTEEGMVRALNGPGEASDEPPRHFRQPKAPPRNKEAELTR